MSRHREAIENISKQLNLVCYEDGMIEKLAPVWKAIAEAEQILKSEYGEGDVKWTEEERAINFSILSKCMPDEQIEYEGVVLTKAEAEAVVKFMRHYSTHLPEDPTYIISQTIKEHLK